MSCPRLRTNSSPELGLKLVITFISVVWARVEQNERDLFWGAEAVKQSSNTLSGAEKCWLARTWILPSALYVPCRNDVVFTQPLGDHSGTTGIKDYHRGELNLFQHGG